MQHQQSHDTKYDRYPNIFKVCSEIISPNRILSFGSSSGEEAFTIVEKYFPNSFVLGIEIDDKKLEESNNKNKHKNISFKKSIDNETNFDIIFCMSVLCRWGATKDLNSSSGIYEFKAFDNQLELLDKFLNKNGLLVIYNSNFLFSDSSVYHKYSPYQDNRIIESGFVHKFNKENNRIDVEYKDVIFVKK